MDTIEHMDGYGSYHVRLFPGLKPRAQLLQFGVYYHITTNEAHQMLNRAILEESQ